MDTRKMVSMKFTPETISRIEALTKQYLGSKTSIVERAVKELAERAERESQALKEQI